MADTPSDLERFVTLLWRPGDVREVRIPTPGRTDSGYFDSPASLVAAVGPLDGRQNLYLSVNPVVPELLSLAANRIKPRVRTTTADAQIVERRWLPIDIDPRRASGTSASDAEREAALDVTRKVWAYLHGLGWPEPVTALSGNGYWLLYPIELPNDAASKAMVDGVLAHLAARFDTPGVTIDTTVSNASRIVALIGTLKVKGDATADRPHRRSALLRVPAELMPVPVARLAALVPAAPPSAAAGAIVVTSDRMPAGWVGALLDAAGIAYRPGARGDAIWYRLASCPFHPDDDRGGDCGVGEDADGKGMGHCFHNRGAGKGWQDFKAALGLSGAPAPARSPVVPRSADEISASSIDAADLLELDIPPLAWIVPDLLPEGTTVLAGPPKLGKSCLVYQVAVEVALGGELLGRGIEQGDVLYLALEDGKRRGQTRLRAALGDRGMPRGRLEVRWSSARLGEGLEAELVDWLDAHPDARLIAIDTLQRVRARGDARRNAYEVDVEDLGRLQSLFRDRAVGLLVVHHSKKDAGDDFLASVSGTYGITGSVDTTLVIQRKRLETFGKLVVTGRDVAEVEEPVQFNGMTWSQAPRSLAEASFERAEVYKVIEAQGPIFPQAIAGRVGSTREAVKDLVAKLVASGSVARVRGGYVTVGVRLDEEAEVAETPETSGRTASASLAGAPAPAGVTTTSTTSASSRETGEEGEVAGTHVRVREDGPALRVVPPAADVHVPCFFYRDHQFKHARIPGTDRFGCPICYPEEGPIA